MQTQVKLELRPNNQITLTKGIWRKPELLPYKSAYLTNNETQELRNFDKKIQAHKALLSTARQASDYRVDIGIKPTAKHLDIILKSQRKIKKPKYQGNKPKSFTKQSGQKLRECGAAIDIVTQNNMSGVHEVTLTLPANHVGAFKALADCTGYVINRLFQKLRRDYDDKCLWFYVWEYQKRGALHLHICVYHPDLLTSFIIPQKLIETWHNILCDISEIKGTCLFTSRKNDRCTIRKYHQNHTAPIEKSVGAYFSKYAGKTESKSNWYCEKYPVSRFWGCSQSIKEIIKANSISYNMDLITTENSERIYQEIIDNILSKLLIVSSNSYEFEIELKGKSRLNRVKDGKRYLSVDRSKSIASGERHTFYICPNCFELAKKLIKEQFNTIYF